MQRHVDFLINSLGGGGAERQVAALASTTEGSRVIMLEDAQAYATTAEVVTLTDTKPTSSHLAKLFSLPVQLIKTVSLTSDAPVISFLTRANLINVLSSFVKRHPVIVSERQALVVDKPPKAAKRFKLWIRGLAYQHADLVVVNSKGTADDLVTYCGIPRERTRVVYNSCEPEKIVALGREAIDVPEQFLVTSGRLNEQKGQDHLLRAFKIARSDYPELRLVVLGTGEREAELKELARSLGISNEVLFLGFQKNPFAIISKAKAFILPSHYEGFPNVVMEALALGVPVISADCAYGPRELLAPDTNHRTVASDSEYAEYGILVPPMTPVVRSEETGLTVPEGKLAKAIVGLLRDTARVQQYRENGPKRVASLTPTAIAQQWHDLINSL